MRVTCYLRRPVSDRVAEARERAGLEPAGHQFSTGRAQLFPRDTAPTD